MPTPNEGAFPLDPRVKEETLTYLGSSSKNTTFLKRSKMSAQLRNAQNNMQTLAFEIMGNESALSQISEPDLYPELSRLRDQVSGWRFYHHFDTAKGSALRQPQIGSMTPLLASDGSDLPSALASIKELGDMDGLTAHFDAAFSGHDLKIVEERGRFSFLVQQPGLLRGLNPDELSDGTLRYICLLAVLKGLRLPTPLILNEPETSLHQDLLIPLADLIVEASRQTQVIVVTHSTTLSERIAEQTGVMPLHLVKVEGETRPA
ncbi:MAG: AAA family ATPase [Alphaproteobacteria bacterium]